ncbi:hypothetical protein KSP40_PGU003263 [Platanthera guangdongensis]|uniref:Calcium uniporter protein C-terminal domain-containing protein n=1 Tax=Platanthera guangdongensis TaxID=2320717 RepID=A0ABR2M523_9ASPA
MAFRKTQLIRFIQNVKSSSTFTKHSNAGTTPPSRELTDLRKTLPFYRRISLSAATFAAEIPPIHLPFFVGDDLRNTIRSSMWRAGSQPEGLSPPPTRRSDINHGEENGRIDASGVRFSFEDTRKLLEASRMEAARKKLKEIPMSCVPYSDFAQICHDIAGGIDDSAREIAAALDNSGSVVVLGNIVFLRPELVARAIERAILPPPISDSRSRELKEMEAAKAVIDGKAEMQVKQEMWAGLGLVLLQTAGFFRLTFWEFSWDVMEPICFFSTSLYFIMGWAFFMRTAREPSFEGFFAGRLASKQRKLMKAHGFDLIRLNQLRRELQW